MNDNPSIEVAGLGVSYDGQVVLHDINLTFRQGEFVALVGRSGSGKSTLLLALAGLIPRHGSIRVAGNVGYVFQNHSVFPWRTVRGNIAFGLHDLCKRDKLEVAGKLLKLIGLEDHAWKYPAQLSGGQAQRVAVAMALAPDPAVLFMDEPFSALDMDTREQMQAWLLDIHEKKRKTTLFVTHSIDEAVYLADRIIVLGGGQVAGEFAVPLDRPRTEDIRFKQPFIELKRAVHDRLREF